MYVGQLKASIILFLLELARTLLRDCAAGRAMVKVKRARGKCRSATFACCSTRLPWLACSAVKQPRPGGRLHYY